MKKDYIVCVVSYKRPNNNTCNLLLKTNLNWRVCVYPFDPTLRLYLENYGKHVYLLENLKEANLANKRQAVLEASYDMCDNLNDCYCIMLDDDVYSINSVNLETKELHKISISKMIKTLIKEMKLNKGYVALSAAYNLPNGEIQKIEDYKNICNNSIFNLKVYNNFYGYVKYNPLSKCEDMEFTMDLILNGALTGRLNSLVVSNILQGGTTNDGLSYRFANTNRFIEEGEYMQNKYPKYKDVFEYDESHFKMNTKTLINIKFGIEK